MLFYETTRRSAAFALSFQATSLTKADSVARCLKTISIFRKNELVFPSQMERETRCRGKTKENHKLSPCHLFVGEHAEPP